MMYNKVKTNYKCPSNFVVNSNNKRFRTLTFFYNKKILKKCHKTDIYNKERKFNYDEIIDKIINDIKKKYKNKIYIIENNNNNNQLNISDEDVVNINALN